MKITMYALWLRALRRNPLLIRRDRHTTVREHGLDMVTRLVGRESIKAFDWLDLALKQFCYNFK